MCGRYSYRQDSPEYYERVLNAEFQGFQPRYNINPKDHAPVIRLSPDEPVMEAMLWSLIPFWSKTPTLKYKTINARIETVAEKPTYRAPYRKRRCLAIADGYYEWQKLPDKKYKQPHYIHLGQPFAFAGLWDHWEGEDADPLQLVCHHRKASRRVC